MKHLRLCFIAVIILLSHFYCSSQGFDLRDYEQRNDFFQKMKFSKEFQTDNEINCKNLICDMAKWTSVDTILMNLHKVSFFMRGSKLDSIKLDTIFSKNDYNYIISQFNYYCDKGPTWKSIDKWKLLKPKDICKSAIPYWQISQPLYSQDFTKCVVKMNFYNNEADYLLSIVLFCKNNKGVWIEKAIIDTFSTRGL
jgi:hypothetical protein